MLLKRLILLNFFRAEAERWKNEGNFPNIIYAVEEPETSQHFNHQILLMKAFIEISKSNKSQIFLTTHSSTIVKQLEFNDIKLIKEIDSDKSVIDVVESNLPYPSLNEINYLANNCKKTIKSIIKKRNQDLNQNTQNKGPFEWNKSNPLPTLEEFMKL